MQCWNMIVDKWISPEWQAEHKIIGKRRLKMGAPAHGQGNLTVTGVMDKHVSKDLLFF